MSTTPRRLPRWAIASVVGGIIAVLAAGTAAAVAVASDETPPIVCPPGVPIVLVPGESGDSGTWACTPLPSATTVTETVTASASPAPTTTAPSPSPTTPAPTTPPATTPAPSPSTSSSAPAGGCMAKPSACGWPDETNTGVPAGITLTVRNGDLTIRQAGAVIDGMDIRGCVTVAARDVTIRNSRISCGSWRAIIIRTGQPQAPNTDPYEDALANLLVEDVEIVLGSFNMKGIAFWGYTARRVHFRGGADCATFGRNVTIEDSFCDIPAGGPADGPHYDGLEDAGGNNVVLRHNTVRVPYGQTSPINADDSTNIAIVDNLVAGGGYAIYCPSRGGGTMTAFSGNVIAKTYFAKGGYWGPVTGCPSSGWRWDTA